ncbi:MAG: YabP/YqfC family sporulation protein [Clostridia bacterium]|nr:YabP/YqfC family sporulation protein [Clostridia bacterium]
MQREEKSSKQRGRQRFRMRFAGNDGEMVVLRSEGATVYACRRILRYSPEEIRLQVGQRVISLLGEGLFCGSFSGGTVSVRGRIASVSYPEAEECPKGGK